MHFPLGDTAAGDLSRRRTAYRTPSGDCLSVNCGLPSFRFNAEQIERECGPRILGLARGVRALVAKRLNTPASGARRVARTMPPHGSKGSERFQNRSGLCLEFLSRPSMFGGVTKKNNCGPGLSAVVVPYPAGGALRSSTRAVTEQVGRDWKQTVIIEARPGGDSG